MYSYVSNCGVECSHVMRVIMYVMLSEVLHVYVCNVCNAILSKVYSLSSQADIQGNKLAHIRMAQPGMCIHICNHMHR